MSQSCGYEGTGDDPCPHPRHAEGPHCVWHDPTYPKVHGGLRAQLETMVQQGQRLAGFELAGAHLERVRLGGACLAGANLAQAHLDGAELAHADLSQANLTGASLEKADLLGANGSQAILSQAHLAGANLAGANLHGAVVTEAVFARANLRDAELADAEMLGAVLDGASLEGTFWGTRMHVKYDRAAAALEREGSSGREQYVKAEEAYRTLRQAYDAAGLRDLADLFHRRAMIMRRKYLLNKPGQVLG